MIKVYGHAQCFYCKHAIRLLSQENIEHEYIDVRAEENADALLMLKQAGFTSVPQCYDGATHIGGFDDLQKYIKEQL